MLLHYILGPNHLAIPVRDTMEWARWFEVNDRTVAQEYVGHYMVSTIFLGLDHQWSPGGPPLLFETMIFNHAEWASHYYDEKYQDRCGTWDDAIDMHEEGVKHAIKLIRQLPVVIQGEV